MSSWCDGTAEFYLHHRNGDFGEVKYLDPARRNEYTLKTLVANYITTDGFVACDINDGYTRFYDESKGELDVNLDEFHKQIGEPVVIKLRYIYGVSFTLMLDGKVHGSYRYPEIILMSELFELCSQYHMYCDGAKVEGHKRLLDYSPFGGPVKFTLLDE